MFSFIAGLIGFLIIGFLAIKQLLVVIQNKKELSTYDFWKEIFELLGLLIVTLCFAAIMTIGISHIFY